MTIFTTCTACGARQPLEAGLIGEDGKRLAGLLADLPPQLARAVYNYLAFFKPPKTELRTATAIKRAQEVVAMIESGVVARDERTGVRRAAAPAHWIAAIEIMMATRDRLELPLDGHGYLRAIVFAQADKADAQEEKRTEEQRRTGQHRSAADRAATMRAEKLREAGDYARSMVEYRQWTQEEADAYVADLRAKLEAPL